MYNFSSFKEKIKVVEERLKKELGGVRTGRATPAILDGVKVESYGSQMPISQVGSIVSEDPRTLRITPYDVSVLKNIEKAISLANLGVSTAVDEKGIRISFPALTTESKNQFVKIAKDKVEQAKISLRSERDKVWHDIQAKEKEGGMGEDEKFRLKDEMEKMVKEATKVFEETGARKEKEILN